VIGLQDTFDREVAVLAASLFAKQVDRLGKPLADDAVGIAELTVATLVRRSAEAVLASAFITDGLPAEAAHSKVVQWALDRRYTVLDAPIGLAVPLVGLGASAGAYYPLVGDVVRAAVIVPTHADVANAVGAVVGRVRMSQVATISSPQHGLYHVHLGSAPATATTIDAARQLATDALVAELARVMHDAGASEYEVAWEWRQRSAEVAGTPMIVEASLTAIGTGRPQVTG
jgi:N-methylhydantoinase A/oxoprolinase/acetone carboxylase beta subunit